MRNSGLGFARSDALGVIAVCVVAGALCAGAASGSRRAMSLGESTANVKRLADATASWGADNTDLVPTFTWKAGNNPSSFPDLVFAPDDLTAAANQATDIIRRRASYPSFPKTSSWIPHIFYNYLILADYFETTLTMAWVASPEDASLLKWAANPQNWQQTGAPNYRAPFGSSYEMPIAFWSENSGPTAVQQSTTHSTFLIPSGARFGGRRLAEVTHPSHKAVWFDRYQRHFGPRVGWFMYDEARVLVGLADGSVDVRAGRNINPGWQPQSPTAPIATYTTYLPQSWEPAALQGVPNTVPCRMRLTRDGLGGRDVDAAEFTP